MVDFKLPTDLSQSINRAKALMIAHPEYQLTPFHRREIYQTISSIGPPVDHLTQGWLAIATVQRVLPVWDDSQLYSHMPEDLLPEQFLAMSEDVWHESISTEQAKSISAKAFARLVELAGTAPFTEAAGFFVVLAAHAALREAAGQDPFESVIIRENHTDAYLDPLCSDAAKYAAAAYSGPVWIPSPQNKRRREFWEWWLDVAIPEAWQKGVGGY